MNKEEYLKKLELIRNARRRLPDFIRMNNKEKATLLKAFNDYEHDIDLVFSRNDWEFPIDFDKPKFEFENDLPIDLIDRSVAISNVFYSMGSYVTVLNISSEETKIIYSAIKDLISDIQLQQQYHENIKREHPDIYENTSDKYHELSQKERFNSVVSMLNTNKDTKKM